MSLLPSLVNISLWPILSGRKLIQYNCDRWSKRPNVELLLSIWCGFFF